MRHLISAKEMLSATLLSIHNLHILIQLAKDMRRSISAGTFREQPREGVARPPFESDRIRSGIWRQCPVDCLLEFLANLDLKRFVWYTRLVGAEFALL